MLVVAKRLYLKKLKEAYKQKEKKQGRDESSSW